RPGMDGQARQAGLRGQADIGGSKSSRSEAPAGGTRGRRSARAATRHGGGSGGPRGRGGDERRVRAQPRQGDRDGLRGTGARELGPDDRRGRRIDADPGARGETSFLHPGLASLGARGGVVSYPDDVRYTSEHEWARVEQGLVTVGITSYATEQLGDVVFVELPTPGKKLEASKPFGVVEAVKTVSDLFAPISGEVVEVNASLSDTRALVNQSPYGEGWMLKLRPANPDDLKTLMSSDDYERFLEEHHA